MPELRFWQWLVFRRQQTGSMSTFLHAVYSSMLWHVSSASSPLRCLRLPFCRLQPATCIDTVHSLIWRASIKTLLAHVAAVVADGDFSLPLSVFGAAAIGLRSWHQDRQKEQRMQLALNFLNLKKLDVMSMPSCLDSLWLLLRLMTLHIGAHVGQGMFGTVFRATLQGLLSHELCVEAMVTRLCFWKHSRQAGVSQRGGVQRERRLLR